MRLASITKYGCILALMIISFACSSKHQETTVASTEATLIAGIKPDLAEHARRSEENVGLVGGWTKQNLDWDLAQADFTRLQELLAVQNPDFSLRTMTNVESQVVAGLNLRLTCTGVKDGKSQKVSATFYHDLEGVVSLTELKFYDLE